jgi:hypothetical protein
MSGGNEERVLPVCAISLLVVPDGSMRILISDPEKGEVERLPTQPEILGLATFLLQKSQADLVDQVAARRRLGLVVPGGRG